MEKLNKEDYIAGQVLLIDKKLEWTSFDVVNKIRYTLKFNHGIKKIKVGHAGTLDPLATGLVIVCCGRKTKEIEQFKDLEKEYVTTMTFGATTPSFDLETETDNTHPFEHITKEDIENLIKNFIGKQQQVAPAFSAKKVNGERAYIKARKGQHVEIKPNDIEIFNIELTEFNLPDISFKITCSKGTYIRALARDFGKFLNSGAHLKTLRRTAIGNFSVDNAIKIEFIGDIL